MKTEMVEKLAAQYALVWSVGTDMHKYCMGKVSDCYETESGLLIVFEKPSIETRFCFGAGQNGRCDDEEWESANRAASEAKEKEYFISANMAQFEETEETLNQDCVFTLRAEYTCCRSLLNLAELRQERYFEYYPGEIIRRGELTAADIAGLKKMLESEKEKFRKRLETYWKRYGSSKLKTWSYLRD